MLKRSALALLALLLLLLPALPAGASGPSPTIGFMPLATREAEVTVRGSAPIASTVVISVNGSPALRVQAKQSMAVYSGTVPLAPGHNRITVQVDGAGATATASIYRVTATFNDLTDDRLRDDIEILATLGVVDGDSAGRFQPHRPLTRAELARFMLRATGLTPTPAPAPLPVSDPAGVAAWAWSHLQAARSCGLLDVYAGASLQPDQPVTRAELVAAALRATPAGVPVQESEPITFTDAAKIPEWVAPSVTLAAKVGLIAPSFWGESFQADSPATRRDTAAILRRLIDLRRPAK